MATPLTNLKVVRTTSIVGLKSSGPTLAETNQPSDWIDRQELDGYQVALVPFERGPATSGRAPSQGGTRGQLLILPWTWKDFVTHVRTEKGGSTSTTVQNVAEFGDIRVDFVSMEVRRSNRLLCLTALEFKVLRFFISNPNRVISREELLNEVWGYDNYPCTRTVDNHILRLRRKLEADLANPVYFRTAHGFGYKFTP
jgi:DNA-binding winged helix-turn-helix (wHTH) protein